MEAMPGTVGIIVRAHNGLAWASLFNYVAYDVDTFSGEWDNGLWDAVNRITEWPSHDLFEN